MKIRNIKVYTLSLFVSLFFFSSCNDFEQPPLNKFTDDKFWTSEEKAERVVNMAYSQMYGAGNMWRDEALSDNLIESRGTSSERLIRNGLADPSIGLFHDEWRNSFGGIKTCHVYLDKIHLVPNLSPEAEARMTAQIRFIRAYIYFRMVNYYGDIPFFTKDITKDESKTIARTDRKVVLDFIHSELDEVMKVLPSADDLAEKDRGRITKGAACALQARTYLYESDWDNVIKYSEPMINTADYGSYGLFPDYPTLFVSKNEYNEEVILDYAYVPAVRTWGDMYDLAPLTIGARLTGKAPTQALVDSYTNKDGVAIKDDSSYDPNDPYKDRDPRLTGTVIYHGYKWSENIKDGSTNKVIYTKPGSTPAGESNSDEYVSTTSNSTPTGYYVRKYFDPDHETSLNLSTNIIMIRYADVLLMYAEAKNEKGLLSKEDWDKTVKLVRQRAKLTDAAQKYPNPASQDGLRKLIRNERRVEFALEGLRWYDIKRWKIGSETLNGFVYGAKFENSGRDNIRLDNRKFDEQRDYLWSIPKSQMDLDPNLKPNNPGYSN